MYLEKLSQLLGISQKSIKNTLDLLENGSTIPFISRYRKEVTGNLDEVQIFAIQKENQKFIEFDKRKITVLKSIEEQGKLTNELRNQIENTTILSELEDIYLPFKPKKRTKAQIAIENGLLPFANWVLEQKNNNVDFEASKYLNEKIKSEKEAINGAIEILADRFSEDIFIRNITRNSFERYASFRVKKKRGEKEGEELYKDYFDFSEKLSKCPAHRVLACFRGEKDGFLNVSIEVDSEFILDKLARKYLKGNSESTDLVEKSCELCFENYLQPQMESEFRQLAKEKADQESIAIFGKNLKQLLLSPPLGQKRILGIDPGFRSGCKVVCIDETGALLHNETIYPHAPQNDKIKAKSKILNLIQIYKIDAISIGNGTAGRETEELIQSIRFPQDSKIQVFVVNEAGASIYSASPEAREEFPSYDVTVRGAVSIARRLMDPLAELVKIDAKSIGVGQYQHDVNQNQLKEELDSVVVSAVNTVGVDLNTASKWLLKYVSGVGPVLAQNIITYRTENGGFTSRKELNKVARLGDKVFEQCAGFLRIRNGKNPLDNTAVHPESYKIVEKMAKNTGSSLVEFIAQKDLQSKIKIEDFVTKEVGIETLKDIMLELSKPGRDPRAKLEMIQFDKNIRKIEDLKEGMILNGIVSNITNFGAFVSVGIKQDGLVHLSEMTDRFIKDPNEVVHLNQKVKVRVTSIDISRNRIQLSMKNLN